MNKKALHIEGCDLGDGAHCKCHCHLPWGHPSRQLPNGEHYPPPSPEQPVTDAEAACARLEQVAQNLTEMDGAGPLQDAADIRAVLAGRTRDKQRIGELERRMRHIRSWVVDTSDALLGEVPDGE